MNKIKIGVIIFSKIGTKTSILLDEFRFFNDFQKENPDCEFIFIAVSDFVKKNILKRKEELDFPLSIITVRNREELYKLNGLSGVFSYMTRTTFFGGDLDVPCVINYMISAYCTKDLGIPLFVRTPDSEYLYQDYKKMIDNRIENTFASTEKFIKENEHLFHLVPDYIDYSKIYFIANGSRKIYDWVKDIAYNDLPENLRMLELDEIGKRTIYVSDEFLFNVNSHYNKYKYLEKKSSIDKLIFIGFLSGSVSKNRLKILPKIFKENKRKIPTDIIGPGASDINISRDDVTLLDKGIYGDNFFETLNSYLGYIFIGKGNKINKYINKTVYDCLSARCPVIVYRPCDRTQIIFSNNEFYFSNEDELFEIYEKLKDSEIRTRWINEQYEEIRNKIKTLMDPIPKFSDYCDPSSIIIKPEIQLSSLF